MLEVFKKKNIEYTVKERWFTCVVTAFLFGFLGYWIISNTGISNGKDIASIGGALLIGFISGAIAFRYPKLIHLTIFALPLLIIGG